MLLLQVQNRPTRLSLLLLLLPNIQQLGPGLEKVTQIKDMLYNGNFHIDKDLVEAKSLATVAYIVLSEAWKIATENAEITKSKHP